jgi:hypothetical protein
VDAGRPIDIWGKSADSSVFQRPGSGTDHNQAPEGTPVDGIGRMAGISRNTMVVMTDVPKTCRRWSRFRLFATCAVAAAGIGLLVLAALRGHRNAGHGAPVSPVQTDAAGGANYSSLIKLIQEPIAADDQPANTVEFRDSNGEPLSERDRNTILNAVLRHALTDTELEDTRGFYGTPGDSQFALVSSSQRLGWPDSYVPDVECFQSKSIVEGAAVDPVSPRRLGIRLDNFNLREQSTALFAHPVKITILNAGGTGDDHSVINGGCSVYFDAELAGESWTVTYAGWFDP